VTPTSTKGKGIKGGLLGSEGRLQTLRREAKKADAIRQQMDTIPTVTKAEGNFGDLFAELRDAEGGEKIRLFKEMFERFPYTKKFGHKVMTQYVELTGDVSYLVTQQ
jgi:hypothetical protein